VAGSAGFLGSNLSKRLLEKGHFVIGVDNYSTGNPRNLVELAKSDKFMMLNKSVTDAELISLVKEVDYVFHFASPASPPKYQELGLETLHANTIGTENLIKLALKNRARMIFASTSEVYGDPEVSPQPESYWGYVNPIGPRSIYDESKRLGETLVHHYVNKLNLDAGIIRIFNTYGPGMDPYDGRVVSTFIRQGLKNEKFTVFGDGKQTRSFCYVDDLINGIIKFAESKMFGPMNLGNPTEMNLLEFGEIVADELQIQPNFEFMNLPIDDPKQRCPDIANAKNSLGWSPEIEIREGIQATAKWIKEELKYRGEL
jgi:nucleoside-diphosphate-sugar epimerase